MAVLIAGACAFLIVSPTNADTGTNTSVRQTLDSLYQTNEKIYTIEQGEYRVSKITKAEWSTWLDSSSKKDLTYNLTWS